MNSINTLQLFEGSYQFFSIDTKLDIPEDFILFKLSGQYEYRKTSEDLWAELDSNGKKSRYVLDCKNKTLVQL
jgi:hypothetical protein